MRKKRMMALLLAGTMFTASLWGCGNDGGGEESSQGSQSQSSEQAQEESEDVVDLEMWITNPGYLAVEKGGVMYNFYKDLIGVGLTEPYVEWNGGETYGKQLNMRIVAGEMPDIVQPVNGMEVGLAKEGALLDMTELLPKYAPNLWNYVPEKTWDVMKSYDPAGEGRIYMIPLVIDYTRHGALIRQDWLDKLELDMPTTQEEFVEVLRAFKTGDPNGNGQADEIPTGGRAEARWMDYLFAMYGIAMWEGFPEWDIYDGELTYSAVTPNMRDALEFISGLYQEGLLDEETLINDKAGWDGKVSADQVGIFYQWPERSYQYAADIYNAVGTKAEWSVMPVISAEGYEGFYTTKPTAGINNVVKNTEDPKKIEAIMKVMDAYGDPELRDILTLGPEGMHSHKDENGNLVKSPVDKTVQEHLLLDPNGGFSDVESVIHQLELNMTEEDAWAIAKSIERVVSETQ